MERKNQKEFNFDQYCDDFFKEEDNSGANSIINVLKELLKNVNFDSSDDNYFCDNKLELNKAKKISSLCAFVITMRNYLQKIEINNSEKFFTKDALNVIQDLLRNTSSANLVNTSYYFQTHPQQTNNCLEYINDYLCIMLGISKKARGSDSTIQTNDETILKKFKEITKEILNKFESKYNKNYVNPLKYFVKILGIFAEKNIKDEEKQRKINNYINKFNKNIEGIKNCNSFLNDIDNFKIF